MFAINSIKDIKRDCPNVGNIFVYRKHKSLAGYRQGFFYGCNGYLPGKSPAVPGFKQTGCLLDQDRSDNKQTQRQLHKRTLAQRDMGQESTEKAMPKKNPPLLTGVVKTGSDRYAGHGCFKLTKAKPLTDGLVRPQQGFHITNVTSFFYSTK